MIKCYINVCKNSGNFFVWSAHSHLERNTLSNGIISREYLEKWLILALDLDTTHPWASRWNFSNHTRSINTVRILPHLEWQTRMTQSCWNAVPVIGRLSPSFIFTYSSFFLNCSSSVLLSSLSHRLESDLCVGVLYIQQAYDQQGHSLEQKPLAQESCGGTKHVCVLLENASSDSLFLSVSLESPQPLLGYDGRWPSDHCQVICAHWSLLGCFSQVFIFVVTKPGDRLWETWETF